MAAVKGSKQYQMVVVPHRPFFKTLIYMALFAMFGAAGWAVFQYGASRGMALEVAILEERDQVRVKLAEAEQMITTLRQELANLKVGGQIDDQVNDEIRLAIEALQEEISRQGEEISFYKGVMLPNVGNKGLRIERLDLSPFAVGRVRYSVLLTQVVEKHEYVEGGVEISIVGEALDGEKTFPINELDRDKESAIRFRFRYFQDINGELLLPEGFEPREVMVVAQSSGSTGQRLEKRFDWPHNGG